ncbi:centromere-associated protein E [Eublepharis macularius]|uniref:Centromere-associated protein E n=1 Tax=Eublepharis macularius TaxID=481883 RepID=A0AA97JYM6_EUBMA|nr:centromere-associated protein E [Eublepharis macularius]
MADEGAVTVCVRVRPLIERENAELGVKEAISWKSEKCNISQVDGTKSFTFDRVFHSEESTAEVYKEVADPIIKSAVRGYNGTIFAYGQTASGKTYTMLGTKNSPGILPMAIEDVFKTICAIPDREFLLRISYMEIHNETIKDLLCSSIRKKKPLIVREDIGRNIYVEDLIEEVVVSPEQVMSWLQKGEKNRHYGETKMNARSSRSHTIFRMIIESKEKTDSSSSNCDGAVMVSHLNLVDLAGSERASQTGTEGIRLKEGCNINRSLFILGQVIKKLCDDQFGGFINYRDSKLTRILQNSLGGNAKTAIICTVTPVSLEETLSTLQFASTAKEMKNSPKVNEVLDDDALLKRYRREIEDLKRRLEEVSSDCHTRNEEKDQLAQLLEEKNSLQKQQQDQIRTLAEMVVTSSSFLQEQELKARKKRRVTWAPGQINHNRKIFSGFPETAKRFKASFLALPEMEESVSSEFSEYDDQCLTVTASIPEEEWIPGPEMSLIQKDFADSVHLCETLAAERDSAVNKQQVTQAELEFLQIEKEQLSQEVRELTEKIEINEFVVLEKETHKEHEMQLMHEISNLKAVIANAEGYNQDLQDDLKSKELQLKEKENKITALEKQITELNSLLEESRRTDSGNIEEVSLMGTSSQMDEMKRSLSDAEIVAMDAKKESAFLRSENRALKERMDQLLDDYNHIKKDAESYKSQLEAGKVMYKKMQSDLQKELQYYFQENAKLTSLLEGKIPEDNQSSVELHEKMVHLKNELNNTLGENISLRKEVAALSETGPKPDLEILHKEILEKSETITSLTSERETLLSQLAEKEQMLLQMADALKAKEDFANAEAVRKNEAVQELKHQCHGLERELSTVSEENTQIKDQIEKLIGENLKLNAAISEIVQELSSKVEELQAKDLEQEKFLCMEEQLNHARQELSHMEQQLKDQLKDYESKVAAGEVERLALVQRLQGRGEEISALSQERDELKQMLEVLQRERDQMKDDIEESVTVNIEAQNELRSTQTALKQCQKDIKELQATVLERESQIASLKETSETTINEQELQILRLTEDLEQAALEKNQLNAGGEVLKENNELQLMREQIFCLEEEKTKLQQQLEAMQEEKALSQESHQLLTIHIKDSQAKGMQEEELIGMKEELGKTLQKLSEMGEQLRASESRMEADKLAMAQELCKQEEVVRSLVQERDLLRHERDTLQLEKEQVQEEMRVIQSVHSSKTQELQDQEKEQEEYLQMEEQYSGEAQQNKSEIEHRKDLESRLEAKEMEIHEMAERLQQNEEERKCLVLEPDDLKHKWDGLQVEKENLKEPLEVTTTKLASNIQEWQAKNTQEEELIIAQEKLSQALQKLSEMEEMREQLKDSEHRMEADRMAAAQELREHEEAIRTLVQERDDLRHKQAALQLERDQVQEEMRATQSMLSSKIQELQVEAREFLQVKEQLCGEAHQNRRETEQLAEQLRALESRLEAKEREKLEMAERLQGGEEERRALVLERDDLKQRWAALHTETEKLKELLEETTSKLSNKTQELQDQEKEQEESLQMEEQHSGEAQQNKSEIDHLKDLESRLEAKEMEIQEMTERLQRSEEERKSLVLERDALKHKWDAAKAEKDKLRELLEETTAELASNIQEWQAKNTQEEELIIAQEKLSQALQKLSEMEEMREQLKDSERRMEADRMAAAQELREHEEAIRTLVQERDDLRHKQAALQLERDQVQEEMRATQSMLSSKIKELQVEARELLQVKEQLCGEAHQNQRETEQLAEQLRALESRLEAKEREKLEMAERLQGGEEERRALVLERDDLKQRWAALHTETEKLKELLEEATSKALELQEQLENANGSLREYHDTVEELRGENSQASRMQENLHQNIEELKQKVLDTQAEVEKLLEKTKCQEQQIARQESLIIEQEEQLRKREAELETETALLKMQLEELTEKLTLQVAENNHLLAKWKAEAKNVQQLGMENSMLKKERDNIQQAMENAKAENDQLQSNLLENTEKFSKTNAKLEQDLHELKQQLEKDTQEKMPENKEQENLEMLQAKVSKITEALQKLPLIEKRYEYLGRIALYLNIEVNNQKALVAKGLEEVSREKAKPIRKLQVEHELVSNSLHRLLNKVQFLFTRLCKKKGEYYASISNYTLELLDERRKQHELLIQIQSLKPCQNPHAAVSQQLRIPELSQNLDFYGEQIWNDVSQMDDEIHSIEVMLQQLEIDGRRASRCSVPFDVQDFETRTKQDSERLLPVGRFLKPKSQVLIEAREELEARKANYCTEAEAALKICRERTRELLQELNTLKELQVPSGHANLILEEENYRLDSKLKAQDQDMQGLKLKIQELENAANKAGKNLLEKEKRIAVLEMELKVRASKSEVVRLRASLEEKENCLTSTVMENQTLKAQLNKGAQLYKEEIEDLKTKLAKADMAIMKQSKCFDREMANAKALAEHRGEQLRKLREDLRQAQQDQDVTVMSSKDISQPSLPITCGGGSGIVQNTQLLMLQCERAKLERELGQLKKEHELLLKNELLLKEEVKKWKERALKMKEQSRDISEEPRLKSPRKTAPPSLAGLSSSPSSRAVLSLDTPPVQLNCPVSFFDNSCLGTFNDVKLAGGESTEAASSENGLKRRIARTNKDSAPECKTQ